MHLRGADRAGLGLNGLANKGVAVRYMTHTTWGPWEVDSHAAEDLDTAG